jgi:hydroxypyruvate reductase/glycerate 2-kinase
MIIRNGPELTSKGNISGRKAVINVIENALEQVNSYNLVKNLVTVSQKDLRMGSLAYDLDEIESIYVIGGGKQVTYVSAALEDVLGDRIREGVVVEKRGWGRRTGKISVIDGGHPIPDDGSVRGANEIVRIAEKADKKDLVIVCITGGCTSLTMLPPKGISLEDARMVSSSLLRSGAPIEDMNTSFSDWRR